MSEAPLSQRNRSAKPGFEGPTWVLITAIYGAWLLLTWNFDAVPAWLGIPLAALLICWHGHLQHEIIHGHPTKSTWINNFIGHWPLALWLPYRIYKRQHLAHHKSAVLTSPEWDPESFFVTDLAWGKMGPFHRWLRRKNMCFAGRMLVGPAFVLMDFAKAQVQSWKSKEPQQIRDWAFHLPSMLLVLVWITVVCDIPLWLYAVCFIYPGLSLTLIRSFVEHRPAGRQRLRTAIVEGSILSRLLFLNNNLHVVHHYSPGLAWYKIPRLYQRNREQFQVQNDGYVFSGYDVVVRKFLFKPLANPVADNTIQTPH